MKLPIYQPIMVYVCCRVKLVHHAISSKNVSCIFYKFPRFACSISIASNNAWKLPAPKPL